MRTLWNDECGVVIAAELILILTVVSIGLIVGLKVVQVALVSELEDVANAISSIDQSFGDFVDDPPTPCPINFNVAPTGGG